MNDLQITNKYIADGLYRNTEKYITDGLYGNTEKTETPKENKIYDCARVIFKTLFATALISGTIAANVVLIKAKEFPAAIAISGLAFIILMMLTRNNSPKPYISKEENSSENNNSLIEKKINTENNEGKKEDKIKTLVVGKKNSKQDPNSSPVKTLTIEQKNMTEINENTKLIPLPPYFLPSLKDSNSFCKTNNKNNKNIVLHDSDLYLDNNIATMDANSESSTNSKNNISSNVKNKNEHCHTVTTPKGKNKKNNTKLND